VLALLCLVFFCHNELLLQTLAPNFKNRLVFHLCFPHPLVQNSKKPLLVSVALCIGTLSNTVFLILSSRTVRSHFLSVSLFVVAHSVTLTPNTMFPSLPWLFFQIKMKTNASPGRQTHKDSAGLWECLQERCSMAQRPLVTHVPSLSNLWACIDLSLRWLRFAS